jgi:hypothetical protein
MKYLLISCGCAECSFGDEPLIDGEVFDTLEEAKSKTWMINTDREWKEHHQGGWYISSGQGDDWIIEVPDDFALKKKE